MAKQPFHRIQLNDIASSAIILLLMTFLIHVTGLFSRVDNLIYDIGQRITHVPAPEDIVIVAIDHDSLVELGRWPWSRQVHADLIRRLDEDQPAAIGMDIVFAEPEVTDPQADQALADAIADADNVVLPVLLETTRANGQILETLPLPILMQQTADVGRVHAVLDGDSIARSVYLHEGLGAPVWQLFSQAIINVANKQPSQNNFEMIDTGDHDSLYSLARQDQRRVNFYGPPGHFNHISYAQVLKGNFPAGTFKDKLVLVGATALGMNDLLTTPVSGFSLPMAGVEFHANVLASLRSNTLITEVPLWVSTLIVLYIALMPLLWMPKSSALIGFLTTILFMIVIAVVAGTIPKIWDIWIPPAAAIVALLLAYPIWSWRKLEAARRFLDYELEYLKKNLVSLPIDYERTGQNRFDQFDARIAQVREATQQLRFLNEERKETLAFISHDLRAPIAGALMKLEKHKALNRQLHKPLSQALALAEDFLQASRAEMMDDSSFVEIDFAGLVHQAVDDAYDAAQEKHIELLREITEDVVWVWANFGLLHRAVLNLILNAVKYSPDDSQVAINLQVNQDDLIATLSITDHGPGISEAQQNNLFKRFSRVKGHEKIAEGTGLGLYFVRTVAKKHAGTVNVDSQLGQYTTFIMQLPVQHATTQAD